MEAEKMPAEEIEEIKEEIPAQADLAAIEEAPKKRRGKKEKKKKTVKEEILSWIGTLALAVVVVLGVRMLIAEPIRVDGTSMTNTLLDGEIVLESKLDYRFGDLQRGDVVICRYPGRTSKGFLGITYDTLFVKRLVALPGDSIFINNGKLYVNGELVPDPEHMGSVPLDYAPRVLGEDEYFVIGDNRYSSHDSRADDVGPLSRSAIMGKVKWVIWPLSNIRGVE